MVWSPDSKQIAIGGGDRIGLFGVASLADPTFRRLAIGRAIDEADTIPLGWLDAQTLLAVDQDGTFLEIPLGDPSSYRIRTEPPDLSVLSPTLDRDASISADGQTLTVRNLASGQNTTVFSTYAAGDAAKIDNVAFAPDGKSIVFTVPDLTGRPTLQVVNADGTGLRQLLVGRFDLAVGAAFPDSPWQPIWP
jgi:WD40-like Beta Propeller Repeat.